MSQQVKDARLNTLANDPYDNGPLVRDVCEDLLSLRAAVRRVHAAEDLYSGVVRDDTVSDKHKRGLHATIQEARAALRAEMARIDGNDPVVVERGGPAPTEALQKITEKQIQEGIDAALRGACKSVDELRSQMP